MRGCNGLDSNKIFLSAKGRLKRYSVAMAIIMNGYFVNITQTMRLKQFQFDRGNNPSENHTGIQNHSKIKSNLGIICFR